MEPITHFLTGACLSRAGFNRKTAYATLAMTLAAEAPDIDILWGFRGPVAALQHHRGITHSLIGAPAIALVVTGAVWVFHRLRRQPPGHDEGQPVRWGLVWLFSLIAVLSHLLLDFTNSYGLRPFYPFNPRWYSWDIVYIVEPVMLAAFALALVMPALLGLADREIGVRRTQFRGRGWAIAALVSVVLLYALRNAEHAHALVLVKGAGFNRDAITRIGVEPYPVNPFKWFSVAETASYYQTAVVNTRTDSVDTDSGQMVFKPPVTAATAAAKQSWLGRTYLDWAGFPLVTDRGPAANQALPSGHGIEPPEPAWTVVGFEDLRFAYSPVSFAAFDRTHPPLSGSVYLGPGLEVEEETMDGREQK